MDLFLCDYAEGAHPEVLAALTETNNEQTCGYGLDPHCDRARALIRDAVGCPEAAVHFLVGGTQTNTTVIASLLKPYQGVLCAGNGHINVHETGAIEASGHKVLALPAQDGKITAEAVEQALIAHRDDDNFEHIVQPGMAYISHPTEYGTLYTRAELDALHEVCRKFHIPLFVDGARLAYGLTAPGTDVTLRDLARLTDVFYIGGTKVGALFGEAVIFPAPTLCPDFRYYMKQRGGMLAKGRLLGVQYEALFTNDLYYRIGRHANELARKIADGFQARGYHLYLPSPTNQQFVVLPDAEYEKLRAQAQGEYWCRIDERNSAYRFCTSWATTPAAVDRLLAAVDALKK